MAKAISSRRCVFSDEHEKYQVGKLSDTKGKIPYEEIESFRKQMYEFQLEVDILKETINVLKKDPDVDLNDLKNKEKVAVIDAMKEK